MSELKIGTTVRLTNGRTCKVKEELGCGGQGVVYAVDLRVELRILYSLWYVLYTNHLPCLPCHEVGNGARPGVEVVD